ncbi:hypothetical protein A9Q84_12860 [Halobacteriovorax marinus]|uniref:Sigma-54 factor interaction domain-containing protein n=1 Tax=Halobacteriovorax marinus TaxID=97084 RepID=A0A1Y5FE90_9BACT|nr:hypothetical protein A9Q84_12860 [Halobacteriovorax marinus]
MKKGLTNFKFYRSFRVKVATDDKIFLKLKILDGKKKGVIVNKELQLIDFNLFSLSFKSEFQIPVNSKVRIELYTKKIFNRWDLEVEGVVIRSFSEKAESLQFNYGVELIDQSEDSELKYFITDYISGFSGKSLKDFLIKSALSARKINVRDGIELFSLLNVLYKEFEENEIQDLINECVHLLQCEEVRMWKINIDSDRLENIYTNSGNSLLKESSFSKNDIGKCFTTSQSINTFFKDGKKRAEDEFETYNTLCLPLFNKEKKSIGVLQFNNKKGSGFSVTEESMAHFLAMVISKNFIHFVPKSKATAIAHLNPELEDSFIYFGCNQKSSAIRSTLKKLKYGRTNIHIIGEYGLGKAFFAKSLANYTDFEVFDCKDETKIEELLDISTPLSRDYSIILKNINHLNSDQQIKIYNWSQFHHCQFITTSHEDLKLQIDSGKFHKELFRKFTKSIFHLTPLRNRKEDILTIARYFVKIECQKRNLALKSFSDESIEFIKAYSWPENITQLEKLIKKSFMINSPDSLIIELEITQEEKAKTISEKIIRATDKSIHPFKIMNLINNALDREKAS